MEYISILVHLFDDLEARLKTKTLNEITPTVVHVGQRIVFTKWESKENLEKSNHFHLCQYITNLKYLIMSRNEKKQLRHTHQTRKSQKKEKRALGLRTNTGTSVYGRP